MKAKRTMSRFLCDKPSLGREALTQTCFADTGFIYLTDDDRDSGTESDDEGAEIEELQKYMESIIHLDSNRHSDHRRSKRQPTPHQQVTTSDEGGGGQAASPPRHRPHHPHRRRTTSNRSPDAAALDSALPSDSDHNFDHHSSEEELEVINSLHHHPEKRKWNGGGGSADEDDEFLCCPVEFRTSPPAHVHKPSKCLRQAHIPPHELCSVSPRKRHRRTPTAIQRPCLDFEKMQQLPVKDQMKDNILAMFGSNHKYDWRLLQYTCKSTKFNVRSLFESRKTFTLLWKKTDK